MCTHTHRSCTHTCREHSANYMLLQDSSSNSNLSHLIFSTIQGEGVRGQWKKRNEHSPHKKVQVTLASPFYLKFKLHIFHPRTMSHLTNLRHFHAENNLLQWLCCSRIILLLNHHDSWPSWSPSNSLSKSKSSLMFSSSLASSVLSSNIVSKILEVFGGGKLCGNVH